MSEIRDDLREALARATFERGRKQGGIDPETWEVAGDEMQAWLLGHADAMIAGPFAPILAQVSALQAEVERLTRERDEARELRNQAEQAGVDLHRRLHGSVPYVMTMVEGVRDASARATSAESEIASLRAEVERLQKVEGERERLGRALGVSVAVLDRAAGEGIMFLPGDDGSPEMDAADACEIISTVIEAEIDGPVWRALLATGWKRLSPSDNPLAGTKEGSDA